jgi:hypothetical protein
MPRSCWAVRVTLATDDEPAFLAGCLLFGSDAEPQGKKLFFRRKDAEAAIKAWRRESSWAFRGKPFCMGGRRVYKRAEPVRVEVIIEPC